MTSNEVSEIGCPPLRQLQPCHGAGGRLRSTVNGEVTGHSIHSYDPHKKCWHVVGIGLPNPTHPEAAIKSTYRYVEFPEGEKLKDGDQFTVEIEVVTVDGEVVDYRCKMTIQLDGEVANYQFTEVTRNGQPVPDAAWVRKKK